MRKNRNLLKIKNALANEDGSMAMTWVTIIVIEVISVLLCFGVALKCNKVYHDTWNITSLYE